MICEMLVMCGDCAVHNDYVRKTQDRSLSIVPSFQTFKPVDTHEFYQSNVVNKGMSKVKKNKTRSGQ